MVGDGQGGWMSPYCEAFRSFCINLVFVWINPEVMQLMTKWSIFFFFFTCKFSSDLPIGRKIRKTKVSENWQWWSFSFSTTCPWFRLLSVVGLIGETEGRPVLKDGSLISAFRPTGYPIIITARLCFDYFIRSQNWAQKSTGITSLSQISDS